MDEGEYRGPEPKLEPHPTPRRRQPRNLPLDFDDPTAAFGAKSTQELLLSWAVFSACQARSSCCAALHWPSSTMASRIYGLARWFVVVEVRFGVLSARCA